MSRPSLLKADIRAFVHAFAQADSWLRAHPPQVQWDLYGLHFPPMNTPVEHALVHAIVDSRAASGLTTEIKGFVAVCDAAHYAGIGVPGVIYGTGDDGFHGIDEYVDLDSFAAVVRTLAAATIRWCSVQ